MRARKRAATDIINKSNKKTSSTIQRYGVTNDEASKALRERLQELSALKLSVLLHTGQLLSLTPLLRMLSSTLVAVFVCQLLRETKKGYILG